MSYILHNSGGMDNNGQQAGVTPLSFKIMAKSSGNASWRFYEAIRNILGLAVGRPNSRPVAGSEG